MKNFELILGFSIYSESQNHCISTISNWLSCTDTQKYLACANPHSIIIADKDSNFRTSLQAADILVPDGIGVIYASRISGGQLKERITGSDIFFGLSEKLNDDCKSDPSYYFLGSTEKTLEKIQNRMVVDYPNIKFAGSHSPPFKDEFNEEDNRLIIETINYVKPDVLWVGMTAPKQEKWIYQNKDKLDVKFIGAIGAVFDFYAGNVKRSHPFFQKIGLEWLPRLIQEPRRLWRRNFISNPLFMLRVMKARFKGERARPIKD